jgi:nucleolar protein TMA23
MRSAYPWLTYSNRSQSTLSQIQKKGINRGGLYGFFVKGESIAGTLGDSDSSADPTDASAAPSGTSTPATSVSDSEPAKKSADKKKKRKRDADKEATVSEKSKGKKEGPSDDRDAKKLAKKIAKLSMEEKATYQERATLKGQTLEVYVARRIQKKKEERANKWSSQVSDEHL